MSRCSTRFLIGTLISFAVALAIGLWLAPRLDPSFSVPPPDPARGEAYRLGWLLGAIAGHGATAIFLGAVALIIPTVIVLMLYKVLRLLWRERDR